MKKHIPNFITCLNLFTGCVAVYIAFQGNLEFAAYLVGIAAVFDFLDGMIARLLHAYSEIGKQLDSLADMVSFGVLPGVIMFQLMRKSAMANPNTSLYEAELFPFLAFIIIIFSALRLAKFNIDTRQTTLFIGLPTPANTLFVASLPLILASDQYNLSQYFMNQYILLGLTLFLSYLLVAEIPLFALKFKNLAWKDNATRFIFLLIAIPLLFLLKFAAVPVIIVLYVLLSFFAQPKQNI
ncbi:CDP-diacylglycerol--serine O-phosphatidyltransferase [Adhaeribacter rhizoryzae]|uniref:CDP-diacylglycerol--serine O-phosphatidyltransferase n=1 Tax=Adhaeribacter rhizoryzae TaxID=2607907 RepID=A0A5M6DMD7_9BACT|nr:CDP-diacylglycerol--serine O-phosphatidyltransferase [Adhaeribacter rhizoryzae]KAA5547422.1 CDP-diacylglycerol--serine O-phosphatidyltransferase [Adhaeribacter rhizoryzae]